MAKIEIEVKMKTTEAFRLLIDMKDDIGELFELVPDYCQEKQLLAQSLSEKWKKMCELIELESK